MRHSSMRHNFRGRTNLPRVATLPGQVHEPHVWVSGSSDWKIWDLADQAMREKEYISTCGAMIIVSLPDKRAIMPPAAVRGVLPTTKVEQSGAWGCGNTPRAAAMHMPNYQKGKTLIYLLFSFLQLLIGSLFFFINKGICISIGQYFSCLPSERNPC